MLNRLVLIDLDKTLIDQNYQITIPLEELRAAINQAQNQGLIIGLCSDSSLATLSTVASEYGINGPIVAERGAMIKVGEEEVRVIPDTTVFPDIRSHFINKCLALMNNDTLLIIGDVNQLSREFLTPSFIAHNTQAKTLLLLNGSRKASSSFYVLANHDGRWKNDPKVLDEISSEFIAFGSKLAGSWWKNVFIDKNYDYGICIIHHPDSEKVIALPELQSRLKPEEIWMIGDGMSDWLKQSGVRHAAVANATPEFKGHCQLVANQPLTAGVVELLDKLAPLDIEDSR